MNIYKVRYESIIIGSETTELNVKAKDFKDMLKVLRKWWRSEYPDDYLEIISVHRIFDNDNYIEGKKNGK